MTRAREQLAAIDDLEARNAHYEVLWDLIVDGADNIAYRLALTTLLRAAGGLGQGRRGAAELQDTDAIRELVGAIAADADEARTRRARAARPLDPAWLRSSTTRSRSSCCC